ncbi:GntR family transcriptional regulator [Streptomyces griseorubiginosus]|uniref:GntR family transcriptional regulator n=1 Tax=Streptomyces griseorubiginosus TaxID=67304 RepID=UPI001AD6B79A|nr:GntR family transcriptional regulator [Streptomyces griseorubiginosus]MBO4253314.1 GntR family transcriptional regulator [Streptomyces griseorubiginosus]
MSVTSSEPVSLGDAAYRQLRADIVSCRLLPGQRLTERSLAESTGFGISPIRDALTRLNHEGLVLTLPRKGYQVTPLTLKSVDDLFTLWRIVGPETVRLGVQDATVEQRRQIVTALSAAIPGTDPSGGDAGERPQWRIEAATAAFARIAEATDNDYLIRVHDRLQNDIARILALIMAEADTSMPDPPADAELIEFIERRDGDAAAARVRDYIGDLHTRVLRILTRWPSVVASEITSTRG